MFGVFSIGFFGMLLGEFFYRKTIINSKTSEIEIRRFYLAIPLWKSRIQLKEIEFQLREKLVGSANSTSIEYRLYVKNYKHHILEVQLRKSVRKLLAFLSENNIEVKYVEHQIT